MTIARDWKYICCLWLSKGAIVFPLMQLDVNTYTNSVIESLFTLIKFMEVVMNVYLRYSFNCWRKWLYILRKWTAKGVLYLIWYNNITLFLSLIVEKGVKKKWKNITFFLLLGGGGDIVSPSAIQITYHTAYDRKCNNTLCNAVNSQLTSLLVKSKMVMQYISWTGFTVSSLFNFLFQNL